MGTTLKSSETSASISPSLTKSVVHAVRAARGPLVVRCRRIPRATGNALPPHWARTARGRGAGGGGDGGAEGGTPTNHHRRLRPRDFAPHPSAFPPARSVLPRAAAAASTNHPDTATAARDLIQGHVQRIGHLLRGIAESRAPTGGGHFDLAEKTKRRGGVYKRGSAIRRSFRAGEIQRSFLARTRSQGKERRSSTDMLRAKRLCWLCGESPAVKGMEREPVG